MKKTPLSAQKELFGDKDKLVQAVKKLATKDLWLDRVSGAKGLDGISNAKLLRLHGALEDAKKRFGSRDKLIAAIADLEKRAKDDGFKTGLASYPLPRLLDLHAAAAGRAEGLQEEARAQQEGESQGSCWGACQEQSQGQVRPSYSVPSGSCMWVRSGRPAPLSIRRAGRA
jgi:hypothetical protein